MSSPLEQSTNLTSFCTVDLMNLGADVIALGVWNAVELGKLKDIRP